MDGRPNTEEKDKLPRGRCPRARAIRSLPFILLRSASPSVTTSFRPKKEGADCNIRRCCDYDQDHLFLLPLGPVDYHSGWIGHRLTPGRILLWDDQVSLSRREDAATMLLTPLTVYSTCADEEQWNRATRNGNAQIEGWTMQKCREVGDVPTTAMALISVFGSATSWREMHNLKARRWPLNDPDEVFCLKRERWVNETPGRAKSGEVGLEC